MYIGSLPGPDANIKKHVQEGNQDLTGRQGGSLCTMHQTLPGWTVATTTRERLALLMHRIFMARKRHKSTSTPQPEWARAILALRQQLGMNQATFAERFHSSSMVVSRWERGAIE